jgi:Mg2+-importing ATPase
MIGPFHASEATFHTGWFIESIATQVLVVFIIRTRANPIKSRCSQWLTLSSFGIVVLAVAIPFSPIAGILGFVPLPLSFLGVLALVVVAYLVLVQVVKQLLNRLSGSRHQRST